ncbi:Putative carboxylesterase, type B, carboxylesterase type B, active, alpha/Beta hydrolase [Septoria linicola]|uniref:Carboxylic ester hydrolase n=1 Tax=Septoria linicola TaxID=215465 RepID=A0A9Q9ALJ3_9PEZI|nr:putative carboxylesterase, type B, carboxylesterase type B, active, alpha/Beta hydrolase [Septoria linicola]USW49193.1 Putative carboxylesterase, type B, carboxylesterase type B, active, alpha/Beta hydrolase [Septoria linicola]
MRFNIVVIEVILCHAAYASPSPRHNEAPTAAVKNGTYYGSYNPTYNTEHFLGMPFAQPPVQDLRFRTPQSLNTSWSEAKNATEYGYQCIGYGRDTWSQGNYVSEDCLTLNVVRSRGSVGGEKLPVLAWIHGGGHTMGGSSDRRYNQSFIVQQAEETGMPIIAVSINYRLSAWGFLFGKEVQKSGLAMLGYRDQRLALQWIQENIEAFGGDSRRVTIQGESAGGTSVGAQVVAYGGRDDGLFSQAIAQSGFASGVVPYPSVEAWEPVIANISAGVGCQNSSGVLDCLRTVPVETLNSVINSTATSGASYGVVIDGQFIEGDPNTQLHAGKFPRVPLLMGCNTDEGVSFSTSVNTTEEFLSYLSGQGYDNATTQDLSILYPDIPAIGIPATLQGRPSPSLGLQYKRANAIVGDIRQHGKRRFTAQSWAKAGTKAYSYRFNVLANGVSSNSGSPHFQEVAFVFYNTEGLGYPQNGNPNPLGGVEREKYVALAKQMTRSWISFVNFGDPNKNLGVDANHWPEYTLEDQRNFVFEQNVTSHMEPDYYRAEGIRYINDLALARKGTNCTGLAACSASD